MIWSFVLAFGSLLGLWFVGKRPLIGWVWLFTMELLWILWSVLIHQYGFMVLCAAYAFLYLVNVRRVLHDVHN